MIRDFIPYFLFILCMLPFVAVFAMATDRHDRRSAYRKAIVRTVTDYYPDEEFASESKLFERFILIATVHRGTVNSPIDLLVSGRVVRDTEDFLKFVCRGAGLDWHDYEHLIR